jgi:anthranilate phosphoribosyltransferase
MLDALTQHLARGLALSDEQVELAVGQLVQEAIAAGIKAEFLSALARKGETILEIVAFARALRDKSISPPLDPLTRSRVILDVCGTGGDHLKTFNISTTVALIVAAAGVTVAKHGNRAITSQAGSADVLEALGIATDLSPEAAARSLRDHQFAFLFAPKYHPAFKHIGPARKLCAERGQRTIFNFLGPLLNPARPSAQLVGVPNPELCEPVARVLQTLGIGRGMVVSGKAGAAYLDELSTLGDNCAAEFYQERGFSLNTFTFDVARLQPASLADLAGGDREVNAEIIRRLLRGEERGPKRDAVLLNAGAALFVADAVRTIADGWDLAADLIDSGKAATKLVELACASA